MKKPLTVYKWGKPTAVITTFPHYRTSQDEKWVKRMTRADLI